MNQLLHKRFLSLVLVLFLFEIMISGICFIQNVNSYLMEITLILFLLSCCLLFIGYFYQVDELLLLIFILLFQFGFYHQMILGELNILKTLFILIFSTLFGFLFAFLLNYCGSELLIRKHMFSIIFYITCFLDILLLIFGSSVNGAKNWLFHGSLQINSLCQFLCLIGWCFIFSNRDLPNSKKYIESIVLLFINIVFNILANELGISLVLLFSFIVICFLYLPFKYTMINVTGCFVFLLVLYFFIQMIDSYKDSIPNLFNSLVVITDKIKTRVLLVLDPKQLDPDLTYQSKCSQYAIIKGGLFGSSGYAYIPNQADDYSFISFTHRFGFICSSLYIVLLGVFSIKSLTCKICEFNLFKRTTRNIFTLGILIQSLQILLGLANILPMSGLAIPFLSRGGSSLFIHIISIQYIILTTSRLERSLNDEKTFRRISKLFKKNFNHLYHHYLYSWFSHH